jgi:hypothetical protein
LSEMKYDRDSPPTQEPDPPPSNPVLARRRTYRSAAGDACGSNTVIIRTQPVSHDRAASVASDSGPPFRATPGDVLIADRGHLLSRLRSLSENRHRAGHTGRSLPTSRLASAVTARGSAYGTDLSS